jgi:preprotein translocase subunit SecE
MNRQMKRMQEKAERQQKKAGLDKTKTSAPAATARRASTQEKRKRTSVRQFLREVRLELKKVDWPNRRELISYTTVVLVTLIVMTTFVFGLDYFFTKTIVKLLGA